MLPSIEHFILCPHNKQIYHIVLLTSDNINNGRSNFYPCMAYIFFINLNLYPGCLFQEEHQTLQMIIHIVGPFHLIMLQLTHTKMQR